MFPRKKMTDEERRIWEAAFATAMVTDFRLTYDILCEMHKPSAEALNKSLSYMDAAKAETIADAVIDRMREVEKDR